jgi:hypothetical protein
MIWVCVKDDHVTLYFRDLLEQAGYALVDRSGLSDYIPLVYQAEIELLISEFEGRYISVIFDGTSRLGDVLAIVFRTITPAFTLLERLVALPTMAHSTTSQTLASVVISTIISTMKVPIERVVAFVHDGASTNLAAFRLMKVTFTQAIDLTCLSHTVDLVGNKLQLEIAEQYGMLLGEYFSSYNTKRCWEAFCGTSFPTKSPTRWWSEFEVLRYIGLNFQTLKQFLEGPPSLHYSAKTKSKLVAMLQDSSASCLIQLQISILLDFATRFVEATYLLEANIGSIAIGHDIMESLCAHASNRTPGAHCQLMMSSLGASEVDNITQHYELSTAAASEYFLTKWASSQDLALILRYASLFDPNVASYACIDTTSMKAVFGFISSAEVIELQREIPRYSELSSQDLIHETSPIKRAERIVKWWGVHAHQLPTWSSIAMRVFSLPTSSGSSERAFSLLNSLVSEHEAMSLSDKTSATVMLNFNRKENFQ